MRRCLSLAALLLTASLARTAEPIAAGEFAGVRAIKPPPTRTAGPRSPG